MKGYEDHVDVAILLLHVDRSEGSAGGRGEVDGVAHVIQVIVVYSKAGIGSQGVIEGEGAGAERGDATLVCCAVDEHWRDGSSGSDGGG